MHFVAESSSLLNPVFFLAFYSIHRLLAFRFISSVVIDHFPSQP
jgi:hypothetical protein